MINMPKLICDYLFRVEYPEIDKQLTKHSGGLLTSHSPLPNLLTGNKTIFGRELIRDNQCDDCKYHQTVSKSSSVSHYCDYLFNG
jgi:hypothetical protein